ncbi:MAG: heavy metal translocating P-type ATPase metal-binding domain-containing protein [Bacteroidota bacterium]
MITNTFGRNDTGIAMDTGIKTLCFHCGDVCPPLPPHTGNKQFCCEGCKAVYMLLDENELCNYYDLNKLAGNSMKARTGMAKFRHLDDEKIIRPLFTVYTPNLASIKLYIPGIHCSSCIYLLEHLDRLRDGVFRSRVNFLKKELSVDFNPAEISFRHLAELLTTIGYEPQLTMQEAGATDKEKSAGLINHDLITRIGVAGFCFGNIMLLSLPEYFNSQIRNEEFGRLFMVLNIVLAVPVVFYGAFPWLRSAFSSLRNGLINIDVPISMGILALFMRSMWECYSGSGPGWFDSMSGLVFFLLIGRYVQGFAFAGMNFRRSWRSFFPLAVSKIEDGTSVSIPATDLKTGDKLLINNREPLPCDCILLSTQAKIDYSFITGESLPALSISGAELPAGGIVCGKTALVQVLRPVNESLLSDMWNRQKDNEKVKETDSSRLADLFAKWFTVATILLAQGSAGYWLMQDQAGTALNAFTAVLIIACPCAFSLSLPFTMGNALVILGRNRIFVRDESIIQKLAHIDHVVLDKTGTLTEAEKTEMEYIGTVLSTHELNMIKSTAKISSHPLCRNMYLHLADYADIPEPISITETAGAGIEAVFNGCIVRIGNAAWSLAPADIHSSGLHININGQYTGRFNISQNLRHGVDSALNMLRKHYALSVLTGDGIEGLGVVEKVLPDTKEIILKAWQNPEMKADFVRYCRENGQKVLMAGDGLNDGPALKEAYVGIAMQSNMHAFTPSSDIIADAAAAARLPQILQFAKGCINIVKISFLLSMVYNGIGLSMAMQGILSPVFAAIFMPVSSMSVVGLSVGLSTLYARRLKF